MHPPRDDDETNELLAHVELETLPAILSALRRRPALRSGAAARVAEVAQRAGRHVCPMLESAVVDGDPEIRLFAARMLLRIPHRRACTLLATTSEDPDARVRECGIVGLSRLEETWARARVAVHASSDPDLEVRKIAAVRLGRPPILKAGTTSDQLEPLPAAPPPPEALSAGLSSPHAFVRERAADLLGDAGDRRAAPALRGRLDDTSPAVRAAAARALAALGDADSAGAIRLALDDEGCWRTEPKALGAALREDVAEALAALGEASVIERLVEFEWESPRVLQPGQADALRTAIEALVDRLGAKALDPLCRVLSRRERAAPFAARLLGHVQDGRAVAALIEALGVRDGECAGAAARALGESGGPDVFPSLLARARSIPPDLVVRGQPIEDAATLVGALDGALALLIERHGPVLLEAHLRNTLELWILPNEHLGDIIEQGLGFHRALIAAETELKRRLPGRPERAGILVRIAEILGRPSEEVRADTRLGDLSASFTQWMFHLSEIRKDLGVELPAELVLRINTVGELADLILEARDGSAALPAEPPGPAAGVPRRMRFWELTSAFRDEPELLREVFSQDRWREPYLVSYMNMADLVQRQDRATLDSLVPLDLSREVASRSRLRFQYEPREQIVRVTWSEVSPEIRFREMSALEVHDEFGGAVIEEVLEYGSARV